jgi:hypothetical protein
VSRHPLRATLVRSGAAGLLGTGLVLGAATAAAAAPAATGLPEACSPSPDGTSATCTYAFTGSEETFVVPDGVTGVDVVAIGGRGGKGLNDSELNQAGKATGTLAVTPGDTLYLAVGGDGGDSEVAAEPGSSVPGGAPGWNGGAFGGNAAYTDAPHDSGAGGGGASDVRTVSREEAGTLESRVLVASGSGGGAHVREGGWGDLNGWTWDGASAAEAGQADRGGYTGDLWGWLGSHGGYGDGGTGRGGVNCNCNGGGGGGGGVFGGGGGAVESSGAGGRSLAPAGGETGWGEADDAVITLTFAWTAPEPEVPVADPVQPPAPTPAGDGPTTAKAEESQVRAGGTQTVTGTGFTPGEWVHGVLHSDPIDLGMAQADAEGRVTFVVELPAGFQTGAHSVVLTGATSGRVATATFTVAEAAPAASVVPVAAPASPELAYTGAEVGGVLLGGLALVGAGGALAVAGRRRRATTTD